MTTSNVPYVELMYVLQRQKMANRITAKEAEEVYRGCIDNIPVIDFILKQDDELNASYQEYDNEVAILKSVIKFLGAGHLLNDQEFLEGLYMDQYSLEKLIP